MRCPSAFFIPSKGARFFIRSFSLLRERTYGASETVTTERATASDGSNPLCPLLPFQTANASLVCGLEPGGFRFPPESRRNQSSRNEPLRSKASYSDALFLLLRCRPQAGSASQKPLRFSWIFPARIDRPMQIRTAQQFLLAVRIFCTYETATAVRFDSKMTGGA